MIRHSWLLAALVVVPLFVLVAEDSPPGSAEVTGKKPKKPKGPPGEDEVLRKALDKWSRPARTERDKLRKDIDKRYPTEEADPAEGSDAEYNAWFDRLTGGTGVWREEEIEHKPIRDFFARVAGRLEVTSGKVSREEFLRYARRYLAPGRSPPWDQKPPRNPLDEAGKVFRKFDRNKDGLLDEEEMPPGLRADLHRWDRNADGRISPPEYQAYFEARFRELAREHGVPLPGKATVETSPETGRPTVYRAGNLPAELPAWFGRLDTDGDGQVGLYEWRAAGRDVKEYLRLDHNRDGFITPEECLRAARAGALSRD